MEIIINTCYGGYSLSHAAMLRYAELKGITLYLEKDKFGFYTYWTVPKDQQESQSNWVEMTATERIESVARISEQQLDGRDFRTDPNMIQVVKELGKRANGALASLKIVTIPDDVEYTIEEYDGKEHIAESHRTWE